MPDGKTNLTVLFGLPKDFSPEGAIGPDIVHQITATLYALGRRDWLAVRSHLSGAIRIIDRRLQMEPEATQIATWELGAQKQIDAALRAMADGHLGEAAGLLAGAEAALLLVTRQQRAAQPRPG